MVLNSFSKWKIAKKILYISKKINKNEILTMTKLSKLININSSNPYFIDVYNDLIKIGVITFDKQIGNYKLIKLNKEKFDKYLEDNEFYREFADYVYNTKLIYADI